MSLSHRQLLPGSVRTRRCALLALLVGSVGAAPAPAQGWNFRPVFFVGVGYDSNVVFTPGDLSPGDYFGGFGLRAPLGRRLSQRTSLSASYNARCEWYRDLQGLDACPSRQVASLAWSYVSGEKTSLSLLVGFAESRRPEEVFPQAGIDYLRGKTRDLNAGVNLSHRLGQNTTLGLGYGFGRSLYERAEGSRAERHTASAGLTRSLWRQGSASLRYSYQLYLLEEAPNDSQQALGLGLSQGLGRSTTLSVIAEARFTEVGVEIRPQGNITLGHSWRRSQISLSYSRSRNYVLTTAGFTETDAIGVSYSITLRRFNLGITGGYARNRLEGEVPDLGRFDTYRGSLDMVYMLARWLGAGATYGYTFQRPLTEGFDSTRRHIGYIGFVITPWNDGEPAGLR